MCVSGGEMVSCSLVRLAHIKGCNEKIKSSYNVSLHSFSVSCTLKMLCLSISGATCLVQLVHIKGKLSRLSITAVISVLSAYMFCLSCYISRTYTFKAARHRTVARPNARIAPFLKY